MILSHVDYFTFSPERKLRGFMFRVAGTSPENSVPFSDRQQSRKLIS